MSVHAHHFEGNRGKVYQVLRRAALGGLPCPTNAQIAEYAGYDCPSSVSSALSDFKRAGLLDTEINGTSRDVVFPDGVRTLARAEWDDIRQRTADAFGLEAYLLAAGSRRQPIVRARMACAWVLRTKLNLSYPLIGQFLGGRDHSSAHYFVRRAEVFRERDPKFRAATDAVFHGEPLPRATAHLRKPRPKPKPPREEHQEPVASWCSQCEARVLPDRAANCSSRWCALKPAIAA